MAYTQTVGKGFSGNGKPIYNLHAWWVHRLARLHAWERHGGCAACLRTIDDIAQVEDDATWIENLDVEDA